MARSIREPPEALVPPRLICLTGIDGSGKTTLARHLAEHLQHDGYTVQYVHGILMRHVLLKPVKWLANRWFMRGTDERANFVQYRDQKVSASHRHRFLSAAYAAVWYLDYCLEAFRRVTIPWLTGKTVVADRYIYDLVLNIALATDRPRHQLNGLVDSFYVLNPRPDLVFVIDTPEEIAFSRKSDVHDIEYLRERRSEYLELARHHGFEVLDGRRSPEELLRQVLSRCARTVYREGEAGSASS